MPKHTRGPWELDVTTHHGINYGFSGVRTASEEGYAFARGSYTRTIAQTPHGFRMDMDTSEPECLANMTLIAAAPDLLEGMRDKAAWLRHRLESQVHVSVKNDRGGIVNGFAAIQIPVWEVRQKLDELDEDIAKAEGMPAPEVKPMGAG